MGMSRIEISTCWSYLPALMIMLSSQCTRQSDMLTSILGPGDGTPVETRRLNRQMETSPWAPWKTQTERQLHVSLHICGIQEIANTDLCTPPSPTLFPLFLNTSPGIIRGNISCARPRSQLCCASPAPVTVQESIKTQAAWESYPLAAPLQMHPREGIIGSG